MDELCMLCKELITNPVTIGEVGKHIELWLPDEYLEGFQRLHAVLTNQLQRYYKVNEGQENEQLICIHCYVKEVYQWLKSLDARVADRFIGTFSFGYRKDSFERESDFHPVEHREGGKQFGICDECGEYHESLASLSGEWVCEDCARYAE